MALLNIFKKKRKKESVKPSEEIKETKEEKLPEKKKEKPKLKAKVLQDYRILKSQHITEKATELVKKNQYTFKVLAKANKREIKKAIEQLFEVNVLSVKIIKIPAKRRRLGRILGWRKGYKKAIVKIKEGQKIDVLPR